MLAAKFGDGRKVFANFYGCKSWTLKGYYHRENGPAIVHSSGDKFWYIKGTRHREDGPATELNNGDKYWWLNSSFYTESDYYEELSKRGIK